MRRICFVAVCAAVASPAGAEVKSALPGGFEIENKATVSATPTEAFAAFARVGQWWNSQHTYSGNAANMSLQTKAGACFCEVIPDGGGTIEHARVVYAKPGETLRLQGGLGPLQAEAVVGTLTWQLKPVSGGTEVTQSYVVGGYVRGGADKLAPIVDKVLGEQLTGLARHLSQ